MPNSSWVETGTSIDLVPTSTTIGGTGQQESPDYLTNADKIALMAQYAQELATKAQLDATAGGLGVPTTNYDNAVANINTTLVNAGAPTNWATTWPDGTTSGPWPGIHTALSGDWAGIATARTSLQTAISATQASQDAASAQAAAVAAAATDATNKMNSAISSATSAAETYSATQAANAQAAATLASQPHQVGWASNALPALPSASYPAGYFALTTDKLIFQVSSDGNSWQSVQYAASGIYGQITAGQLAAGAVTAGTIAAGAVTASTIAASAVQANNIAAGAITTNKLAITSNGPALNNDPFCTDATAWTIGDSGSFSVVSVSDGLIGTSAIQVAPQSNIRSLAVPIVPGKKYRIRITIRAVGSVTGINYLRLYQYGASGPSGTLLNYTVDGPYEGFTLPGTSWTTYTTTVTAANGAAIGYLSFHGSWTSSGTQPTQVQDFEIEEQADGSLIVDGSITASKIAAGAITADMITSGTLNAGNVNVTNLNASNITTGNLAASRVSFPDGSVLTTAGVLTALLGQSGNLTTSSDSPGDLIPGLSISWAAASTADVFNFFGSLYGQQTAGSAGDLCYINLAVDGILKSDAFVTFSALNVATVNSFFISLTGLAPGNHTFQFYLLRQNGAVDTFQSFPGTQVLCQRVF